MGLRRRVLVIFVLSTFVASQVTCNASPCGNSQARVSVVNVTEDVEFKLPNETDLSTHQITVTYKWDLSVKDEQAIDGFLYKFYDTDQNSYNIFAKRSLTLNNFIRSADTPTYTNEAELKIRLAECKNHWDRPVWTVTANGSYIQCPFPCTQHFGIPCLTGTGLCSMLKEGHKWLKRDVRSLTFDVAYGRHYTFEIAAYVKHTTTPTLYTANKVFLFCGEHLINERGVDRMLAYQYCNEAQNISEIATVSSPVTGLEIYQFIPDYARNKVSAIVRWKAPHDVVKGKRIEEYVLSARYAALDNIYKYAKTPEEEALDPYYNVTMVDLSFNDTYTLNVLPYVHRSSDTCVFRGSCASNGNSASISVVVSDLDGCATLPWSNERSYCDEQATCVDLGPEGDFPANCSCGPGYQGNGVRPIWPGGNGCRDVDACLDYNITLGVCHEMALCVDRPAPETGFDCECQDRYFGDGLKVGSGCANRDLVVGLAVGIPLVLLFILCAFFLLWRLKIIRKRSIDMKLSEFVPVQSNGSTLPLVIPNNRATSGENGRRLPQNGPVFGAKWEIQRSDIVREGVIGRGNFGVVHKATLMRNGEPKTVAVKSLTDTYASCYRSDFLAEMSLLISLGSHDNVLGVVGVCTSQMGSDEETLSPLLVTEHMAYGDLLHFLWDAREPAKRQADPTYDFTENSLYNIGHQVANGLQFLSSSKIIHGDVAARNILVDENLQCKISDFGLANDVYRYGMIKGATERRVPFKWVSPERMMGGKVPITWRSDVWSFGILLYEMVTLGAAPYPSMEPRTIFNSLRGGYRMPKPESCNDYLYSIMSECWRWSAIQRPTFVQLKEKLAKPLSQHTDPSDLTLKRSIHAADDLDIEQYEADIGRRDRAAPNGCLENGSVTANGGNGLTGVVNTGETAVGNGALQNGDAHGFWDGSLVVDLEPEVTSNGVNGHAVVL